MIVGLILTERDPAHRLARTGIPILGSLELIEYSQHNALRISVLDENPPKNERLYATSDSKLLLLRKTLLSLDYNDAITTLLIVAIYLVDV